MSAVCRKLCKKGLLIYCGLALVLFIGLNLYNQMLLEMIMEPELWFVPIVLYGPYLFLGALVIWPSNKTTGQYVVLLFSAVVIAFHDFFKILFLLDPDATPVTSWFALIMGWHQIIVLLVASIVLIFIWLRKKRQDQRHEISK